MVGKRVRGALYIHRSAIACLPEKEAAALRRALTIAPAADWNVARVEARVVGLLRYEEMEAAAFPALLGSIRVDIDQGKVTRRDFSDSGNPLILHRKELLVDERHPRALSWSAMTKELEDRELFTDSHLIGRRRQWLDRLARAGLTVVGDEIRVA